MYTFVELQEKGLSSYQIKCLVRDKKLYKIENGLYSTKEKNSNLEIITKLYNNNIVTLNSAFFYYGLIKKEPDIIFLATVQKARKIKRENIKQIFMSDHLLHIGEVKMKYKNVSFNTYCLERLLIELVRNKTSIDSLIYDETINSYKKLVKLLNKNKIKEYINYFKDPKIEYRINKEVYGGTLWKKE